MLNEAQKTLLILYGRSMKSADANGWVNVASSDVWEWIEKNATPDIFEMREQSLRLTDAGKVLLYFRV